ncbi:MAG: hypothetical protein KA731_01915 [Candidatus Moranbacteria bacterium]|nr:hypothetical protein [Candidatus Moranbacteria bacterium]MBP7696039.1 hypothetical protein [Candidatus Moranbacteria bacterium]
MRKILDFIKYNNAFPLIVAVVLLGTGAAFASSPELRQAVFAPADTGAPVLPKKTDTKQLVAEDMKRFDLGLRIDAITEDAEAYHAVYAYQTLAVAGGAWQPVRKTGKMDIPKKLLGKRDLGTYLAEQIGQVIDREVAYLREAQAAVRVAAAPTASSRYAGLVGQPVKKPAAGDTASATETDADASTSNNSSDTADDQETVSQPTGLSDAEIRAIIVEAVAEFLAVDTSMPEPIVVPADTVSPSDTTEETVAETPIAAEAAETPTVSEPTEGE